MSIENIPKFFTQSQDCKQSFAFGWGVGDEPNFGGENIKKWCNNGFSWKESRSNGVSQWLKGERC